jgi:cytochrome P450
MSGGAEIIPPCHLLIEESIADLGRTDGRLYDGAPICRVEAPECGEVWLVTRYEDARAALADPRLSNHESRDANARLPIHGKMSPAFHQGQLNVGPSAHAQLRRMLSTALARERVGALRERVQDIAEEILDRVAPNGEAEIMADFAFPLSSAITSEALGVPADARDEIDRWTSNLGFWGVDGNSATCATVRDLREYLESLIAQKRSCPLRDIIGTLETTLDGEGHPAEDELVATALLLILAGNRTMAAFIGNAMLALLLSPESSKLLIRRPELLASAIEELLRLAGPVEAATSRLATENVTLRGVHIPQGSLVTIVLASANRDPERFVNPDQLMVARTDNAHLGFGHGSHGCLGAPLARFAAEIGIGTILHRLPNLCLAVSPDDLRWWPSAVPLRGLLELPVWFTPEITHSLKGTWQGLAAEGKRFPTQRLCSLTAQGEFLALSSHGGDPSPELLGEADVGSVPSGPSELPGISL